MSENPVLTRSRRAEVAAGTVCALTILLLALAGPGCSRVQVHTHIDPSADFTAYRSFDFLPKGGAKPSPGQVPRRLRVLRDPLYHGHLQEAVTRDLREKGLVRTPDRGSADLLIGYRTIVKDRVDVAPPIYGRGWRGRVYVAHPGHVRWYKEGTLVLDIIDRRTQDLIWRGIGVGAMRDMRPGDDLQAAVREILAEFPPDWRR